MGVSGSGKSVVGQALARDVGWPFFDADDFHPEANVAKMAAGTPLTDDDRWPWLDRLAAEMAAIDKRGGNSVLACSALRQVYRDRISRAVPVPSSSRRRHDTIAARRGAVAPCRPSSPVSSRPEAPRMRSSSTCAPFRCRWRRSAPR
jgi:hypothetical protein